MPWFNVDDSFYDHPKVWDAPDCAVALWCRAGSWSARSPRRGFVPAGMPARLCGDPEAAVRELLGRGLWIRTKGGYLFHDWNDWNLSSEEVERKKALNAERQRRYRDSAKGEASDTPEDANASVTRDVTRYKRVSHNPQSNPIHPVADVSNQSSGRNARNRSVQPPILAIATLADAYAHVLDDDDLLKAVIDSIAHQTGRVLNGREARAVAAEILGNAKGQVANHAGYIQKSILAEKDPAGRWLAALAEPAPREPFSGERHAYEPGHGARCATCSLPESNRRHQEAS